jgi:uncharacterized protein (TIGR03086 family)
MQPHQVLEAAVTELQRVIDTSPINANDRQAATPCDAFTVDELIDHILDTHNLLLGGAGGQPVETTGTVSTRHQTVAAVALEQWKTRGIDGTIDLGGNKLPAEFGISLHALECYIHAWDLAQSLDRTFTPPEELTAAMRDFAQGFITDDVRGDADGMPYRAEVSAPDDATDLERIIALSGRNPAWQQN